MIETRPRDQSLHLIWLYLVVAFTMAWSFWLIGWFVAEHKLTLPLFPILVIGSFGPLAGAIAATMREGGVHQIWKFLVRAIDPRMGWSVFLISFFLLPLIAIVVELIHAALTHQAPTLTMTVREAPMTYVFLFVLGGTLAEEYGWSFLSDKLDNVLALVPSTFVLGVIWALWHVPLFFIVTPGAIQGYTPFYIFLLATVAMRFLFAWAYHRSGRNILSNMLFHTASNMAYSLVALAPSPDDMSTGRLWLFAAFNIFSACVLWAVAPPRPLKSIVQSPSASH